MVTNIRLLRRLALPIIPALVPTAVVFAQEAPPAAPPPVVSASPAASPTPAPSGASGRPVESTATNPASRTVLSPEAEAALRDARPRQPAASPTPTPTPPASRAAPTSAPSGAAVGGASDAPADDAGPIAIVPSRTLPDESPAPANPLAAAPVSELSTGTPPSTDTAPAEARGGSGWLWIVLIAAVVLGGLALVLRRRRTGAAFGGQYEPEADYYAHRRSS